MWTRKSFKFYNMRKPTYNVLLQRICQRATVNCMGGYSVDAKEANANFENKCTTTEFTMHFHDNDNHD